MMLAQSFTRSNLTLGDELEAVNLTRDDDTSPFPVQPLIVQIERMGSKRAVVPVIARTGATARHFT